MRGMGCKTVTCSPPEPATLHDGVRHVRDEAGALGAHCEWTAGTGRRKRAPYGQCVVQVGRAVHFLQPLWIVSRGHEGRRRWARTLSAWNAASS